MIKLRPFADEKDLARAVSDYLTEHGQEAMKNTRRLDPQGEHFYQQVTEHLGKHYNQLTQLMNLTMNDQASAMGHEMLAKVMLAAWTLGTAAAVAPEVKQKLAERKTADMRKARSETPAELALIEAIEAERGGRPVTQPKKEAGAMLDAVNAKLVDAGHATVKLDVVRRRLGKLVRS